MLKNKVKQWPTASYSVNYKKGNLEFAQSYIKNRIQEDGYSIEQFAQQPTSKSQCATLTEQMIYVPKQPNNDNFKTMSMLKWENVKKGTRVRHWKQDAIDYGEAGTITNAFDAMFIVEYDNLYSDKYDDVQFFELLEQ